MTNEFICFNVGTLVIRRITNFIFHGFLLLLVSMCCQVTAHAAGNIVQGLVSLPQGELAATDIIFDVIILDKSGKTNASVRSNESIAAGQSSTSYSIIIPSDYLVPWEVFYQCVSGCGFYGKRGYYTSSGTVWDSSAAEKIMGG